MKINYIRVSASAMVILANVLCGNTKETDATTNAHHFIDNRLNSSSQQNNYNSDNTIIPVTKRII